MFLCASSPGPRYNARAAPCTAEHTPRKSVEALFTALRCFFSGARGNREQHTARSNHLVNAAILCGHCLSACPSVCLFVCPSASAHAVTALRGSRHPRCPPNKAPPHQCTVTARSKAPSSPTNARLPRRSRAPMHGRGRKIRVTLRENRKHRRRSFSGRDRKRVRIPSRLLQQCVCAPYTGAKSQRPVEQWEQQTQHPARTAHGEFIQLRDWSVGDALIE